MRCCGQGGCGGEAACVREGGVGLKNPETERGDSVSGVPCETMVWGDDRRVLVCVWHGGGGGAAHLPT
jgi:hypothetical protein